MIASSLVRSWPVREQALPECPSDPTRQACREAQDAIGIWLVQQFGAPSTFFIRDEQRVPEQFRRDQDGILAAAERFAALSPAEQQAWLRANFAALREGRVPLSTLP